MDALTLDEYEELQRVARERQEIVSRYDKGREEGAQIDEWEDPAFEVYHVTDRYGFIHDKALGQSRDAAESKAKQIELERTTKWVKMHKSWNKYFPGEKLTRRVYKGIPDRVRGVIWSKLLGVQVVKATQEGIYNKMKTRARSISQHIRQIDLDVNRTYRNHIMFRERFGTKQQALFHVLSAYSMYNTEVGYCQGMSEVAALLLMYLNEEDAFWALSQLFTSDKYGMHGFFMSKFPKLIRFQEHHENILKKFLPKIRRHMEKEGIDAGLYTIKYFLQCFLDRLPFTLTLRIWDIYVLEGDKVLTGMSYTIIKLHRRKIRKHRMDTLLQFFQQDLTDDFGYDDDTVIDQLQVAMEELRKAKMDVPPKATSNEQPTLPFGLEIQPSNYELIKKDETFDEHFRKNIKGGKAAYYRKRAGGNSTTPDLGGRGADTRSIQSSRYSEYSVGDQSSYYDTAANSRLSITDFSTKTSPKSSRTSFDGSDMESLHQLGSRHTPVPINSADMEIKDIEEGFELNETLTRDATMEDMSHDLYDQKPPSQASDYDNIEENEIDTNYEEEFDYDNVKVSEWTDRVELKVEHVRSIPIKYEIPVTHQSQPMNMHRSTLDGIVVQNQQNGTDHSHESRESVKRQIGASNSVHSFTPDVQNGPHSPSHIVSNGEVSKLDISINNSSIRSNKSRISSGSGSLSPVNDKINYQNSHSSPNTPTYGDYHDRIVPPPKFVSQLEVVPRPTSSQDRSNGFRMQVQYSEQQVQDRRLTTSSQIAHL